jgi:hypothetical protein
MKKSIFTLSAILLLSSCGFKRYGDFTVLANGNVDTDPSIVKLKSQAQAIVKTKKNDPLEQAVDDAVHSVEGGEYLKNVTVYFKKNGRKVKVVGDVYGKPVVTK